MRFILFAIFLISSLSARANSLDYFKDTYNECDRSFVEQFAKIKKNNSQATIHQFQYSEGTIRSYFFPASKKQKSLLIMISGTHGIEAFTGSAVQRWLLDQKIDTTHTALLMIHGFNLYGFKNYRRVNENNIDLNRNFLLSRSQFKPNDQTYAKLNDFLNPSSPANISSFSQFSFLFRSFFNIAVHSLKNLRTSILKGQYSFPEGLYYGGSETAIQQYVIYDLIQTFMKPYKKIFLIDLHTGYGERSKLHLFAGKSNEKTSVELLKIFKKDEINFADQEKFYAVEGDLLTYFINKIRLTVDAEISGITFEYGTLNSQKTMGSIESLRRVVLENQNFHHPGIKESSDKIKFLYREMFYPSDKQWRLSVIDQTKTRMDQIFQYLNR